MILDLPKISNDATPAFTDAKSCAVWLRDFPLTNVAPAHAKLLGELEELNCFEMPPGGRMPPTTIDECVDYAHLWKDLGATRYWVTAPWADLGPEETGVREPGKEWSGVDARIDALRAFKDAIGPDF